MGVIWPETIRWTVNKEHDVSNEPAAVNGFFVKSLILRKWIHDNEDHWFNKDDVFRCNIIYSYKKGCGTVLQFTKHYTVNVSSQYGRYFDMEAVYFREDREKEYFNIKSKQTLIDNIMAIRATPINMMLPPKVLFIQDLRRRLRKSRNTKSKRLQIIDKIEKAKVRLGITESTFIAENVTTERFKRYFAVDAFHGGFGYLRRHIKDSVLQLTTRTKRFRRMGERQINIRLAQKLGIKGLGQLRGRSRVQHKIKIPGVKINRPPKQKTQKPKVT